MIEAQVFGVPFLFRVAVLSAAADIPAGTGWHPEGAETSGQVAPCARDDPQFGNEFERMQGEDHRIGGPDPKDEG